MHYWAFSIGQRPKLRWLLTSSVYSREAPGSILGVGRPLFRSESVDPHSSPEVSRARWRRGSHESGEVRNMQEDNRGLVNLEWYIGSIYRVKGRLVTCGRRYFCGYVTLSFPEPDLSSSITLYSNEADAPERSIRPLAEDINEAVSRWTPGFA